MRFCSSSLYVDREKLTLEERSSNKELCALLWSRLQLLGLDLRRLKVQQVNGQELFLKISNCKISYWNKKCTCLIPKIRRSRIAWYSVMYNQRACTSPTTDSNA